MTKKVEKTTIEPIDVFLKRLVSVDAEISKLKFKRIRRSSWESYIDKGKKLKIPKK